MLLFQLISLLLIVPSLGSPVDITIGREYHGEYISQHPGVTLTSFRKVTITSRIVWGKSLSCSMDRPIMELSIVWRFIYSIPSIEIKGRCSSRSRESYRLIMSQECGRAIITPSPSTKNGKIGILSFVRFLLIQLVKITPAPSSSSRT